jgi:hypothetical protein
MTRQAYAHSTCRSSKFHGQSANTSLQPEAAVTQVRQAGVSVGTGPALQERGAAPCVYPYYNSWAVIEGSILMIEKPSFAHLIGAVLAVSFIVGFAIFVLSGATTNKGTTGAIGAENATILSAEKTQCVRYGTYASIATLRREGLLTFKPVYNSVVYVPGKHCGTIIVGSSAYQSPSG